jgi:hypothetical protein
MVYGYPYRVDIVQPPIRAGAAAALSIALALHVAASPVLCFPAFFHGGVL